jgi:hypothetical protein
VGCGFDDATIVWPLPCGLCEGEVVFVALRASGEAEAERFGSINLAVEDTELDAKGQSLRCSSGPRRGRDRSLVAACVVAATREAIPMIAGPKRSNKAR